MRVRTLRVVGEAEETRTGEYRSDVADLCNRGLDEVDGAGYDCGCSGCMRLRDKASLKGGEATT